MKHSSDIYDELKEVSPFLAGLEKTNVFSVPADYFLTLHTEVLQILKDTLVTLFPVTKPRFSNVPEGYFDSLSDNILRKIKSLEVDNASAELKQLSPMLYTIQNENVFSIPKGYFENLPGVILDTVKPQQRIVSIKKRSKVWNYAVAAMLSGVVVISALLVSQNSTQQSAQVSKVTAVPSYIKEASRYKNEQQINEAISTLAADDIIKYLEATGTTADEELLSTIVQGKDLPTEEDYLLNEDALKSFMADLKNTGN